MVFASVLGLALLATPAAQDSPRLRTLLANGATVLVERFPQAKTLSVQLFVGSRGINESAETHGHRHLLEHLLLKDRDRPLEQHGIFFTGRTYRDAIQFELTGKTGQLEVMLRAAADLLAKPNIDQAAVDRERSIMAEEFALVPDHQRLSRTAWEAAFGRDGLDPFGTEDGLKLATPASLIDLHKKLFRPAQIVIVVAGNVELKPTTEALRAILEDLPADDEPNPAPQRSGHPARGEATDAFGEVRGALVNGLNEDTAATLCAAYALATWIEGAYVTYTVSNTGGLVLVGRTEANNSLGTSIDQLGDAELAFLYPIGKTLARSWINDQLATPSGSASMRGLLLAQASHLRPESLVEGFDQVGWSAFRAAVEKFRRDQAVIAVGVKR